MDVPLTYFRPLISYDQTWFKYLQLQLMSEVVQHRVYIAPRQVPVSQQKMCGIKSCLLYHTDKYMNVRHQKLCVRYHLAGT